MGAAAAPIAAGTAVAGGAFSAYEQGEAGKYQAGYYSYLARTAKTNASLALATGEARAKEIGAQEFQEEQGITRKISGTIGAQKASVVNGAGASSRTAQDIVSDTLDKGNLDEMALRYNADRATRSARIGAATQALNFESEATGYGIAGGNAMSIAKMGQVSSLLGGAQSAASIWYRNPYTG